MREIRLAGDGTKRDKFRRGESHHVIGVSLRIGHAVEFRSVRGGRPLDGPAQLQVGRKGRRLRWLPGLLRHDFSLRSRLLANYLLNVTAEATFSAVMACCRSSASRIPQDLLEKRH